MHIFRHERETTTVGALWARMRAAAGARQALDLLAAAAQLECGLSDAGAGGEAVTEFSAQAAALYLGLGPLPAREAWRAAWRAAGAPERALSLSALEGLRYYALEPAGYAMAARRWRADHGDTPAWVIGLRSMGSVLAPVAVAALRAGGGVARLNTLRPVGAPQDRKVVAGPALVEAIRRWRGAFLIVDEGPGLSGSSFGGTVAWLRGLGVAVERISLLPSWRPSAGQLCNAYAARQWPTWQCYVAAPLPPPAGATIELSAGRWRRRWPAHGGVAVWPQQERRKYLTQGGRVVAKFAGLGAFHRQTRERAGRLAAAAWTPAVDATSTVEPGWLGYRLVRARPLPQRPGRDWCVWAGAYLAWRHRELALGAARPPSEALQAMVAINAARLRVRLPVQPPAAALAAPPVAVDNRLQRWEWGVTRHGYVKFDATDHADDPFFPGPCDIAWDLAAIAIEFGAARGAVVVEAYGRASGESAAQLAPRLAWHRHAYAVFRAAYASFACTQVSGAEAARFAAESRRYRRALDGAG